MVNLETLSMQDLIEITILALCLLMMSMPDIYQVQNYVL